MPDRHPSFGPAPTERVDVHQHLWPEAVLSALAARRSAPRLVPEAGIWRLRLNGEPDCHVNPADHDPETRAALVTADGLDRALVSLSSPVGIEALPRGEAAPLLEAFHQGAAELPAAFGAWAAAALDAPDAGELEALLDAGFVGLQLPAAALGTEDGYRRCAPLLDALEGRSRPLLVHPGPAPWALDPPARPATPGWWPALTGYVAQMSTAWHAFLAWGRPRHPSLRVAFVMLAGLGPLHGERLRARGGPHTALDPDVFLDASSYGVTALDAAVRVVGVDQLLHGSDRPVVQPPGQLLGPAVAEAMLVVNPARLLTPIRLEAHA